MAYFPARISIVNLTFFRGFSLSPRQNGKALSSDSKSTPPLIFISAAEPSADLHAASLIRATHELCPEARFVGVAGPRMIEAGCERIFDMASHSAMLLGAIFAAGRAASMMTTCDRYLRMHSIDAAVVIDSPMLHLPLAARAQGAGVPVMYYIAPQMWAWGAYRIHKLRNRVDEVAVILPFEEKFFRDQGVKATYVGHPLADQFHETQINPSVVEEMKKQGSPFIALLPGSRKHEVAQLLPDQLEVARKIVDTIPGAVFGISVANPQVAPLISSIRESLHQKEKLKTKLYPWNHKELIEAADLVLVTSGTTTLEVAFHHTPMIVMYNASKIFYHLIARWLISTPYLSLPNILAGKEIVPEFMPYYRSTDPIAGKAIGLLQSEPQRREMIENLTSITQPFHQKNASENAAKMLLELAAKSGH